MFKKLRQLRKYERESFNARIVMEERAQKEIEARLVAIKLELKNEGRLGR